MRWMCYDLGILNIMNDLPKSFVKNVDQTGMHTFNQLKKVDNVYMYERVRKNGTTFAYEVFISKFIAKGTQLPGGLVEKEDRWQYPGAKGFGANALCCNTMQHAEQRFDEMVDRNKQLKESRAEALAESERTGEPVKRRGSVSTKKAISIVVPAKGKRFTMKMLMAEYDMAQPVLYPVVQSWLQQGLIAEDGEVKAEGRGRPSKQFVSVGGS